MTVKLQMELPIAIAKMSCATIQAKNFPTLILAQDYWVAHKNLQSFLLIPISKKSKVRRYGSHTNKLCPDSDIYWQRLLNLKLDITMNFFFMNNFKFLKNPAIVVVDTIAMKSRWPYLIFIAMVAWPHLLSDQNSWRTSDAQCSTRLKYVIIFWD